MLIFIAILDLVHEAGDTVKRTEVNAKNDHERVFPYHNYNSILRLFFI